MKKLLKVILIILSFKVAFAQNFDVRVRLTFDNLLARDSLLVFGAVNGATDGIDKHLGEIELPPFLPPEFDLFVVFDLDSLSTDGLFSYKDFRSVPSDLNEFYHRYRVELNKRVTSTVTISWEKLSPFIKYAYISDELGLIFGANMLNTQSVFVNNTNLNKIPVVIDVIYTKVPTKIDDISDEIELYPNPANDKLIFKNYNKIKKVEIFNVYNQLVSSFEKIDQLIDIRHISNGYYLVKIYKNNGNLLVKKLIINR